PAADYFAAHAGVPPETATHFVADDIHAFSEADQMGVFNLINLINTSPLSHVLVATGNAAPRDLAIRRDLASRLGQGLVFYLTPLTDDEKSNALRIHARTRGYALRDDVIAYLLRHSRRDMTALMSFLDALDLYSLETGREITLPLLREMSQPQLSGTL
ncbi:MAG: DnaA regulatory inactivator Hda, partial [Usitatibacteraceae bacterium]